MPRIEQEYRAARWRNDLLNCLVCVVLIILIQFIDFHTDLKMQAYYNRQHFSNLFMWVKILSLGRMGFTLYSLFFSVWLVKMLVKPKPFYQRYDRFIFAWLMLLVTITGWTSFLTPRWYTIGLASHIPALMLFYFIIPQHNFGLRILPGLFFTVGQLILYAFYKTPPLLFGFKSVYTGYILSNIIAIIYSHRLYLNERRNFGLHRKKNRMMAVLAADKRKLQREKELVARYEAELRRQEVRREKIKALQAQIKPHFLFNSLSVIAFKCRTNPDQAYHLVNDLAICLQSSFTLQSQAIPWEDELKLVHAYLSIEAARMGKRLSFAIEETGDLSACRLPPFTVQPLVENAVRHGLAPKPGGGTLTIIARETPDSYFFEVNDNGLGFDPTRKPDLFPNESGASGGIGLSNIEERLQGLYGCGLTIESRPGSGTTISFGIPKQKP